MKVIDNIFLYVLINKLEIETMMAVDGTVTVF